MDKQHPYQIEIPEGYQYCPECELLTPHTYNGYVDKVRYPENWACDICDHVKNDYGYCCPMCGWEHDPDNELAPVTIKIKKHTTSCLEKQKRQNNPEDDHVSKRKFNSYYDYKNFLDDLSFVVEKIENNCDCPKVDAYPIQHIYNYRSSTQHWNMECSNAIEWSYDVMCKVCCYVFEVEDGNC
jgi:hypothetical protein